MEQLTVQILGRDYRLSCEPAERDDLLAAVAKVDAGMQAIRDQGKIAGTERIAVFTALNLAGELVARGARSATTSPAHSDEAISAEASPMVADLEILRRMQSINALLDTALASQERLF